MGKELTCPGHSALLLSVSMVPALQSMGNAITPAKPHTAQRTKTATRSQSFQFALLENTRCMSSTVEHFDRHRVKRARTSDATKDLPAIAHWSSVVIELNLERPWRRPWKTAPDWPKQKSCGDVQLEARHVEKADRNAPSQWRASSHLLHRFPISRMLAPALTGAHRWFRGWLLSRVYLPGR
jgi:hypothetical protein